VKHRSVNIIDLNDRFFSDLFIGLLICHVGFYEIFYVF
jgi:hypothetical protein